MIIVLIGSEQVQGAIGGLYTIGPTIQYCLKTVLFDVDRVAYKCLPAKLQANHAAAAPLATPGPVRHSWTEAFDAVHKE